MTHIHLMVVRFHLGKLNLNKMKQIIDAYFYTLSSKTQEEAKQICLGELDTELILLQTGFKFNQTDEQVETRIAVILRQIRMVEANLCQRAVWNKQPIKNILLNDYENPSQINVYENQDGYRNFIRIKCDDINLLPIINSYQDLINFVNLSNLETNFYQIDYVDLNKYYKIFTKFPQSFIKFE
jgi:hypothetical protein